MNTPPATQVPLLANPTTVGRHPEQYVQQVLLRDGMPIVLRPIRPADEPLMVEFHEALRERTVRLRYSGSYTLAQRTAHDRLLQVCTCDNDRDITIVAERDRGRGGPQVIGVGRLTKTHVDEQADLSLVVDDVWQNVGVGTALLKLLLDIAHAEGLRRITGRIGADNSAMRHLAAKEGFATRFDGKAAEWRLALDLGDSLASR